MITPVLPGELWRNGIMTNLNNLLPAGTGWELGAAYGINNKGQKAIAFCPLQAASTGIHSVDATSSSPKSKLI